MCTPSCRSAAWTTDCLIAAVCIRADRPLLHRDVDFDHLARVCPLRVVERAEPTPGPRPDREVVQ